MGVVVANYDGSVESPQILASFLSQSEAGVKRPSYLEKLIGRLDTQGGAWNRILFFPLSGA